MKRVVVFAPKECLASSITGPVDVFNIANGVWQHYEGDTNNAVFSIDIVTIDDTPVTSSSGIVIAPTIKRAAIGEPDILLLGAIHFKNQSHLAKSIESSRELIEFIKRIGQYKTQIGAFCTATFLIGESGLLENFKATTSWWLAKYYQQKYPTVDIVMDQLVVQQNNIWTAGASTSYLSLCLKMIDFLVGPQIAQQTGQILLVDNNRLSQLPFMSLQQTQPHSDKVILSCQRWLQNNIGKNISVSTMAEYCATSPRNLIRRFKKSVGQTPSAYLKGLRVDAAKRLLENTDYPIDEVMYKVGYRDQSAFRRVFVKATSLTPSSYRAKFNRRLN